MQSNKLYDVSLATEYQGLKSDHQLQVFKESREVSTKFTEQPQSDEWLELKRNQAYVASTTLQIPTVDNDIAYDYIQIVWLLTRPTEIPAILKYAGSFLL